MYLYVCIYMCCVSDIYIYIYIYIISNENKNICKNQTRYFKIKHHNFAHIQTLTIYVKVHAYNILNNEFHPMCVLFIGRERPTERQKCSKTGHLSLAWSSKYIKLQRIKCNPTPSLHYKKELWFVQIDPRHRYGHNLQLYYNVWFTSQSSQPFFYW